MEACGQFTYRLKAAVSTNGHVTDGCKTNPWMFASTPGGRLGRGNDCCAVPPGPITKSECGKPASVPAKITDTSR